TVFAPTDDAFAKLPAGTVDSLIRPENKQKLVDILKYHVIAGRVYDDEAVKAGRAPTLLNRSVEINFSADGISINGATVLAKNINASNGVIHVIDEVLLPSSGMSPGQAMTTLTSAINRGVPIFNSGHHGQCCDIYSSTMTTLVDAGITGVDDHTMSVARDSIARASRMSNDADRAWELRRGIDSIYNRLAQMPMQR
ncbi:MAG: fasciclin domain-containing protein, partial [Mariniblastus sp.]|nr:fasciclin domain-containing protein [Mariniblastus sp.]